MIILCGDSWSHIVYITVNALSHAEHTVQTELTHFIYESWNYDE